MNLQVVVITVMGWNVIPQPTIPVVVVSDAVRVAFTSGISGNVSPNTLLTMPRTRPFGHRGNTV